MTAFTAACIQMRSGRSVADNIAQAEGLIREAAAKGAHYVQTPEMTNILERTRADLFAKITDEAGDPTLARFRALAQDLGIWLHAGSLAIRLDGEQVANRAFLIAPDGGVRARYDKIHMFDVDLPNGESWRESATYRPGTQSVVADLPWLRMGLAVCYDVRFPAIFRSQARQGAQMLTMPAAFTRQTGQAHWHVLQRSRAIENGAFVVSAAQGGRHEDGRETYGHSLIVGPWGEVLAEADHDEPGIALAEIRPEEAAAARQRIPAIANERDFVLARAEEALP
ncbi:carbon-nitrogen hydrolase family protein [Polymorphum gilvum]|uniref:Nitrilase/cyanide hydratase and apolipoprotein N-acyltransferase n=1 Tax=Polymorphum gilvum (strain LMG 25793 / CGMCC 1.9160 / SL003B-26A1) TaxID=991905 RepID=F2J332_POLGS|nr:carbon-nitrogen hydrolase family protein [Polymorphum gilvum]ADZ68902.1 Nitrilase/cyanide hydratase and apolipoprotein N-acyltransferase [Polymorphum gilvum SL003B-26A1]